MITPTITTCSGCGKGISKAAHRKRDGSFSSRAFCHANCWKLNKKAKSTVCKNCKCEFTGLKFMRGRFVSVNDAAICSRACYIAWLSNNSERKRKISAAFSGANHPNWKGGFVHRDSRGPGWQKQAARIRKRDGYKCLSCGIGNDECLERYGRILDVDHKTPFHNFTRLKDANHPSNLQTLCASCHRISEAKRTGIQMSLPIGQFRSKEYTLGEDHPQAKATEADVIEIRKRHAEGETISSIAKDFAFARHTVGNIARRRSWTHVP